jgi:hypothetical protein
LAQFAVNEDAGLRIGDGGEISFAIPEQDLATNRFDRVVAFSQSM